MFWFDGIIAGKPLYKYQQKDLLIFILTRANINNPNRFMSEIKTGLDGVTDTLFPLNKFDLAPHFC